MSRCLTPSARAASTWSLSRWASIEPRSSRAKIGTLTMATAKMTVHWLDRLAIATRRDRQQQAGQGQHHVGEPHQDDVDPAAEGAGERAEEHAERSGRSGWRARRREGLPGAVDHAGEEVPAERVGAEREAGAGAGDVVHGQRSWSARRSAAPGRAARAAARRSPPGRRAPTMTAPTMATGLRRSRRSASRTRLTPPCRRSALVSCGQLGRQPARPSASRRRSDAERDRSLIAHAPSGR